jgi:prolipoprotein diacylglyceryltransferase
VRPELFAFEWFGERWTVSSFAVAYAFAITAGAALVLIPASNRKSLLPHAHELIAIVLLGGYVVSRLTKPLVHGASGEPTGGTWFFGWALGAGALLVGHARWRGLGVAALFDAVAPAVLLGSSIGRVGCLLAGCCHGRPCGPPWGLPFPSHDAHLFPVQFVHALGDAAAFGILWIGVRPRASLDGTVAIAGTLLYAAFRFPTEFLRDEAPLLAGLTQGQVFSLAVASLAAGAWIARRSRRPRPANDVEARRISSRVVR